MLLGVLIFVTCLSAIFGIIAVHECGHYLAGGATGIPWRSMKIRLGVFPQHVALRSGDDWLHPLTDYEKYGATSMVLLKSNAKAAIYVSGGLIVQTIAFVLLVVGFSIAGVSRLWVVPVACALASVPLLYLCADLIFTPMAKRPCGDFSVLWKISPLASVVVAALVVGTHVAVLLHILGNAQQGARANDHGCHDPCSEQHGSRQPRSWLILNVSQ
jgi:hypothetical protein